MVPGLSCGESIGEGVVELFSRHGMDVESCMDVDVDPGTSIDPSWSERPPKWYERRMHEKYMRHFIRSEESCPQHPFLLSDLLFRFSNHGGRIAMAECAFPRVEERGSCIEDAAAVAAPCFFFAIAQQHDSLLSGAR